MLILSTVISSLLATSSLTSLLSSPTTQTPFHMEVSTQWRESNAEPDNISITSPSRLSELKAQCEQLDQQLNEQLAALPKAPLSENPALLAVMKTQKKLAQCHGNVVLNMTTGGYKDLSPEDALTVYDNAKQALLHNHGDNHVHNIAAVALHRLQKNHSQTINAKELKVLQQLSYEANFDNKIQQARRIWDDIGRSGSVYVKGVETKFTFIAGKDSDHKHLVVIAPGRGESMYLYKELMLELRSNQIDSIVIGFTGNGDTGKPGHINSFDDYTNGLAKVIDYKKDQYEKISIIGHSTGGLVTARYCEENPDKKVRQALLVSPMFGLQASEWEIYAASVADSVLDKLESTGNYFLSLFFAYEIDLDNIAIANPAAYYKNNHYTQSPQRYREIFAARARAPSAPPTVGWVNESVKAYGQGLQDAGQLKNSTIKTTVYIAGADSVVDNAATEKFIESSGATGHTVDGSLHSMLQEADPYRQKMVKEIIMALRGEDNP